MKANIKNEGKMKAFFQVFFRVAENTKCLGNLDVTGFV